MGDSAPVHVHVLRLLSRALAAAAASVLVLGLAAGAPAVAAPGGFAAGVTPVVACMAGDASCDVDGDRIPDDVEVAVCGSVTCATGAEDGDGDGLADWVEFQATGSVVGADPAVDSDGDGIPDVAELIVCGTAACAVGDEDADGDGVPDWIEVVICGDVFCATGAEDFDGDGIADAVRLAARPPSPSPAPVVEDAAAEHPAGGGSLASTGSRAALLALIGAALVAAGVGLTNRRRRVRPPGPHGAIGRPARRSGR